MSRFNDPFVEAIKSAARSLAAYENANLHMRKALETIANNFDESWAAGCVERQMGDVARAALARAKSEQP